MAKAECSGGEVLRVEFGEHGKAIRRLRDLDRLPDFDPESAATIYSDGETVYFLTGGDGEWVVQMRVRHEQLDRYLGQRRVERRHAQRDVKQSKCDHSWARRNRNLQECTKCWKLKARKKAWTICNAPQIGTRDDYVAHRACAVHADGSVVYHVHGMRCRRRKGHDGPCRFSGRRGLAGAIEEFRRS